MKYWSLWPWGTHSHGIVTKLLLFYDVLPWGQIAGLWVWIRLYSEEKLCFKHKLINLRKKFKQVIEHITYDAISISYMVPSECVTVQVFGVA
jgi:hypothetical protein